MTTTINISLPNDMYDDAKKVLVSKRYSSISELIRDSLRKTLYSNITVNGFTEEFENEVLRAEKEPEENDIVLSTEKEMRDFFRDLKLPLRYNKNKKRSINGQSKSRIFEQV